MPRLRETLETAGRGALATWLVYPFYVGVRSDHHGSAYMDEFTASLLLGAVTLLLAVATVHLIRREQQLPKRSRPRTTRTST